MQLSRAQALAATVAVMAAVVLASVLWGGDAGGGFTPREQRAFDMGEQYALQGYDCDVLRTAASLPELRQYDGWTDAEWAAARVGCSVGRSQ
jgi:hypothetical protein